MLIYSKPLRFKKIGGNNLKSSRGKYRKLDMFIITQLGLWGWEADRADWASRAVVDYGISDF